MNETPSSHPGLDTTAAAQAELKAYQRDARHGRRNILAEVLPLTT